MCNSNNTGPARSKQEEFDMSQDLVIQRVAENMLLRLWTKGSVELGQVSASLDDAYNALSRDDQLAWDLAIAVQAKIIR